MMDVRCEMDVVGKRHPIQAVRPDDLIDAFPPGSAHDSIVLQIGPQTVDGVEYGVREAEFRVAEWHLIGDRLRSVDAGGYTVTMKMLDLRGTLVRLSDAVWEKATRMVAWKEVNR